MDFMILHNQNPEDISKYGSSASSYLRNLELDISQHSLCLKELWYWTLYWDLIWGLSLIWDLKKTEVYDLARHINKDKEVIPQWIIDRKASAELSEWQVDPFDYDRDCDPVDELAFWWDVKDVAKKYGLDEEYVQSLKDRIERSKFKVAQVPPIIKISDHPLK